MNADINIDLFDRQFLNLLFWSKFVKIIDQTKVSQAHSETSHQVKKQRDHSKEKSEQDKVTGKNGFSGVTGELKLLCNAISTFGGGGDEYIEFTTEGLNVAFDFNFMQNILKVKIFFRLLSILKNFQLKYLIIQYILKLLKF